MTTPALRVTPLSRLRAYGHSRRIVGVDIARGLAVLGMFGAHIGLIPAFDWTDPASWSGVVSGRSAILFALLAGVSIAIISGGSTPFSGQNLFRARIRILVRALVLFLLGALLEVFGTNVAVILTYYAVYFALALPFVRWRPWALFCLAGAVAIGMPFAVYAATETYDFSQPNLVMLLLLTGYYPAAVWIAFVLVGIGIGRLDLRATGVRVWMLVAGAALAFAGYGLGAAASDSLDSGGVWAAQATTEPHSGSPFEVVGSTGVALGVLALCLLASGAVRWVMFPVAVVGSMALTAYSAQIAAIAALRVPVPGTTDNRAWLWFVIVALAACSLWFILVGRGPLERGLTWLSHSVAAAAGSRDRPSRPHRLEPGNGRAQAWRSAAAARRAKVRCGVPGSRAARHPSWSDSADPPTSTGRSRCTTSRGPTRTPRRSPPPAISRLTRRRRCMPGSTR
jgi:uncharacterized membrane protein